MTVTDGIVLGAACLVLVCFAWGVVKSRRLLREEPGKMRAWHVETRDYQMQEAARFFPFHRVERIAKRCDGKEWRS